MIRKIIQIDENKCNGCGICAKACHEGAIGMADGKAKLLREDYCDGLGDCLPACPTQAIRFVEKETAAFCKETDNTENPWPVQIKLAPVQASCYDGAELLIAADCTAFRYERFYRDFVKGRGVLIGCPKLDKEDYSDKLTEILRENKIKSIQIIRMEVPCCGGLERAVEKSVIQSGAKLPWQVVTISVDGKIKSIKEGKENG
ncbi:ATP-binding protein [Qiania dongpingensis]|uniref:4Fe-4S binding protein n=1 Tax=Qiania dongpingensis TaxID=2763669 RepID=A0A7G9G1C3_9FIRM|nr:4Fe-4S binding protein [Qiania dongpingensis]QNM04605.1 4Fe-4S binding protein [Qiania dongpingensis]